MAVTRCPLYILSGGNCFPDQQDGPSVDNHRNYRTHNHTITFWAEVSLLSKPLMTGAHWPCLQSRSSDESLMVTLSSQHSAITSSPSQSRVLTTVSWWWVRWDVPLFIWTLHVDDGDPRSIKVLLINSIWQIKILLTVQSYRPGHGFSIIHPPLSRVPGPPGDLWCCKNCEVTYHRYAWDWRSHSIRTVGVTRYQDHVRSPGESVNSKV